MSVKKGSMLIVGGGIGGIQAAIDLANSGFKVFLLDEKPYFGGKMVQLYRTVEDLCSICAVTPKILEAKGNPNIVLLPGATVKEISGVPGQFEVRIEKAPRYVDVSKCISCGLCWMNCPVTVKSEFNLGLGSRKAIYMAYAGAVPNTPVIDRENCLYFKDRSCEKCAEVCPAGAINFSDSAKEEVIKVGAVLLTAGLELYQEGEEAEKLGLGRIKDVISNFQLDRLISIYGPTVGELKRPSDGKIAKEVAIILCVDQKNPDYPVCSTYCCGHAYRAALEITSKYEDARVTIYHDDLCNYGYLWERVYRTVKDNERIEFVKTKVLSCEQAQEKVKVIHEGGEASFDLVALALPMKLSSATKETAERLGLELDDKGFVKEIEVGRTARDGVFVGATSTGPREIPSTCAYAEAAACEASCFLQEARGTMTTLPSFPEERDVAGEEPRIGVFICRCGGNISDVLDCSQLAEFARDLDGVEGSFVLDFACFPEGISFIKEKIKELDLNRVVVVACSFRSHLAVFQRALRQAALNPHLVTMVNAREAIAWPNREVPEFALQRVKEELVGALGRARSLKPLRPSFREVTKRALVVGGGISGMVAALGLAKQGFPTYLVEKEGELGGQARRMFKDVKGRDISQFLFSLIKEVEGNELIEVLKGYKVAEFRGHVGQFQTVVEREGTKRALEHGVLIIATGASEYRGEEYGRGEDRRIISQLDLEERLKRGEVKGERKVFMLQCVGSRDEGHPYCSGICCQQALKNALILADMGISVTVGTKGMVTPGDTFELYLKAKEKGVRFVEVDDRVQIERGEKLIVNFGEGREEFDLVVLSAGIVKSEDNDLLSFIFGLPLNEDGFFEPEDHVATATPVEFSKRGIFVCGVASGPKTLEDSIAEAKAAAQRAATVLSKERIVGGTMVSKVDSSRCVACLTCVRVCPFSVPHIGEEGVAEILPEECRGCGICAAACPRRAIQLEHFEDEQLFTQIGAILSA